MPLRRVKNFILHLSMMLTDLGGRTFRSNLYLARIFAVEGILITAIVTLAHNNNNLYASRLGATASDLGLMASLPPVVGMIFLIPFAIVTDRMKNKRLMVIISTLCWTGLYVLVGTVAFLPGNRLPFLISLLVLINVPMSLYNLSWQAFFSDVVPPLDRNSVYSHRTRMSTALNVIFPLLVGGILALATGSGKIIVHQIYYWLALPLAIIQVILLRKISEGDVEQGHTLHFSDVRKSAVNLFKSRKFMGFLAVALLVYSGWEMDWSLNFVAQFNYLKLNEIQINFVAVLGALTQFLTLGVWSRLVTKKGIRFVFIIGAVGFAVSGGVMFLTLLLPVAIRLPFYFLFLSISSSSFSAFQISVLQCLLEVIPEKNRTLSISIYSTMILFSNIIMPYLGIYIYNSSGASKTSMIFAFGIITLIRVLAAGAAILRWLMLRHEA